MGKKERKIMLTKDFTGVYDYERGEAENEAQYFIEEIVPDSTPEECRVYAERIAAHWRKCLDADGFADFSRWWNKLVTQYPI